MVTGFAKFGKTRIEKLELFQLSIWVSSGFKNQSDTSSYKYIITPFNYNLALSLF